ncbi:hypothetical protein CONPUDRAFT_147259 [Coniophora puteana RWD-64-598 SS2]|uniref:BTB domain-containing protein n=1 Tax=Coniophora puteana (strain RWD-64-598) TaxID=741705 RepID=A0A5M3M6S7_CONPW|nr:uncharacterized protein CONPUDRAFT_147259 [Coniophora puteana RWD-64-598 SS2]EIW75062.1 hypothetical protein CONPUDRAFT_147259 [Coniophora puteana RWD-64-598 SS2]
MTSSVQVTTLDHPYSAPHPACQAKAPFDDPEAEIILRSSDNVEFRVFKLFLAFSSSIFRDMLSLPQPSDDPQTVDLTESSTVLRLFLLCCYPVTCLPTYPFQPSDIADVAEAAQKYDAPSVTTYLRQIILSPHNLQNKSVAAFAVCDRFQWREEAKKAAFHTLKHRLPTATGKRTQRAQQWFLESNAIPEALFIQLTDYHSRCGTAASNVGKELRWAISFPTKRPRHQCERVSVPRYSGFNTGGSITLPEWFADFVKETSELFAGDPDVQSVLADHRVSDALLIAGADCSGCRSAAPVFMQNNFVPQYRSRVEKALEEVELYT